MSSSTIPGGGSGGSGGGGGAPTSKKAPATTPAPKIPSTDGYTAQGYCPVAVTVDVVRGATSNLVTWEFHSPVGFTKKTDGTVLNKISAVELYAGDAAGGTPKVTIAAEGDKVAKSAEYTYATTEKGVCVWVADVTFQTSEGVTMRSTKDDGSAVPVIKKGIPVTAALLGYKDDNAVALATDSLDSTAIPAGAKPTYPVAARDLHPGDIVPVAVERRSRITGAVYPTAIDEDWTVEDRYAPALNVNVATTGGQGSGHRFGVAGALIPGDGVDVAAIADFKVANKFYPSGTTFNADGTPNFDGVLPWYKGETVTVNDLSKPGDPGVAYYWKGTDWEAGEQSAVRPLIASAADVKTVQLKAAPAATEWTIGNHAATDTLEKLNAMGGIDFDVCYQSVAGDYVILDSSKPWPAGAYVGVKAPTDGPNKGKDGAYWTGSQFIYCPENGKGAPAVLPDPYSPTGVPVGVQHTP